MCVLRCVSLDGEGQHILSLGIVYNMDVCSLVCIVAYLCLVLCGRAAALTESVLGLAACAPPGCGDRRR